MSYGMYISAEGAQAQSRRLEIVANNMANVNTVGFKPELLDHEVLNPIRAGEVVTTDAFAPPMLVHRGDAVTVSAGGGGIRIRVLAKAQVDGRRGEIIEVESPETKQRFTARVVGPRQLAILSVDAASAEVSANTSTTRTR